MIAPIVFEAAEDAKTTVGTVTVVGLSHFGDRKEALELRRRRLAAGAGPHSHGAWPAE